MSTLHLYFPITLVANSEGGKPLPIMLLRMNPEQAGFAITNPRSFCALSANFAGKRLASALLELGIKTPAAIVALSVCPPDICAKLTELVYDWPPQIAEMYTVDISDMRLPSPYGKSA